MEDIVDTIVDRFRDAALGLADWSQALGLIAETAGGHMAQLAGASRHDATAINFVSGVSDDQIELYFKARGNDPAVNPRTRHILTGSPGQCVADDDIFGGERSRPPIYDDLFRFLDVPHALQVRLDTPKNLTFGLVLLRSASAGRHGHRETDLLRLAAPGIAGAVQTAAALGAMQDRVILDTAETLSNAAILLDRGHHVVSMSTGAEAIIRTGKYFTVTSSRLFAVNPGSCLALDRAIGVAAVPVAHKRMRSRIVLTGNGDGERLMVDLSPLPTRLSGPISRARVLLTIRIPQLRDTDSERVALITTFALTPAEADIALSILDGKNPAHVAAQRGTSVSTVRTQLKAVFEKTRTRRQAELVSLIQQLSR